MPFCGKIKLHMNNKPQEQYKARWENNQLVLILNSEFSLPEDAPVRVTGAQLEELDYRKLYEAYSSKGRKSATDPRVMFKVMVYGYQCGIFSTRDLEDACKYRIDFKWLLENEQPPKYTARNSRWGCKAATPGACIFGASEPKFFTKNKKGIAILCTMC